MIGENGYSQKKSRHSFSRFLVTAAAGQAKDFPPSFPPLSLSIFFFFQQICGSHPREAHAALYLDLVYKTHSFP